MDNALVQSIGIPAIPSEGEVRSLALIADYAARSGFLRSQAAKTDMMQRQADAFFVIMYGREMGIPPMTALKTIWVLNGQPTASSQAILAMAKRRGVEVQTPNPAEVKDRAIVKIRRPGGEWREYVYTDEMAARAGLSGKDNWKKHHAEMLIWRAVSTGLRFEAPDIIGGLYSHEEIAPDIQVDESGEIVEATTTLLPEPAKPLALPQGTQSEPDKNEHWSMTPKGRELIQELIRRSRDKGYIEAGQGESDLLLLIGKHHWQDYDGIGTAGQAILAAVEALQNQPQRMTISQFKYDGKKFDFAVNGGWAYLYSRQKFAELVGNPAFVAKHNILELTAKPDFIQCDPLQVTYRKGTSGRLEVVALAAVTSAPPADTSTPPVDPNDVDAFLGTEPPANTATKPQTYAEVPVGTDDIPF
jgi:hypothetical protein